MQVCVCIQIVSTTKLEIIVNLHVKSNFEQNGWTTRYACLTLSLYLSLVAFHIQFYLEYRLTLANSWITKNKTVSNSNTKVNERTRHTHTRKPSLVRKKQLIELEIKCIHKKYTERVLAMRIPLKLICTAVGLECDRSKPHIYTNLNHN